MAFLYIVSDGEPDGLFWIEAGAKPENDLSRRLVKSPSSRFYLAARWEIMGGPAGATFMREIVEGAIPADVAKRYADGAWSGNIGVTIKMVENLYRLFLSGPADRISSAEVIKNLRAHLGVQMVMLAQVMGVSVSMISRVENGLAEVSWQHIIRILDFCHIIGRPVPPELVFGKPPKVEVLSKGKQHEKGKPQKLARRLGDVAQP